MAHMALPHVDGVAALWGRLTGALLPARCVGCGAYGTYLCATCLTADVRLGDPCCPTCATPGWTHPCTACMLRPPAFETATAPFLFTGAPREAVLAVKYRNLRVAAPVMARHMAAALGPRGLALDVVVPVPLHAHGLRRRGYNQAGLLAHGVALALGLPFLDGALGRTLAGRPQVTLTSREARWANVAHAFAAAPDAGLGGRRVLLVDDVLTTGSTMHAAASALRAAGATAVHAVAFAREA